MDKNLIFRFGPSSGYVSADGYGVNTQVNGAGNLTATFVSNILDLGPGGQVPWEDLQLLVNFPQAVATTGAPTSYTLQAKLDFGDNNTLSTVVYTQTFQVLTFTVTSNAAKQVTVNSVNTSLPAVGKATVGNNPHEFVRLTLTVTANGGTSPTVNFGPVSAWLDLQAEDHPFALFRMD